MKGNFEDSTTVVQSFNIISIYGYDSPIKNNHIIITFTSNYFLQHTTDTERKLAAMGISSSADFAGFKDDFDEPELTSQVIAPARARTPSPNFQSTPPPSYDSATKTKKVLAPSIQGWGLRKFERSSVPWTCESRVPSIHCRISKKKLRFPCCSRVNANVRNQGPPGQAIRDGSQVNDPTTQFLNIWPIFSLESKWQYHSKVSYPLSRDKSLVFQANTLVSWDKSLVSRVNTLVSLEVWKTVSRHLQSIYGLDDKNNSVHGFVDHDTSLLQFLK